MSAYLLDLSQSLLIIDAALAAFLICAVGLGTARLLKRCSASLRHGVLFAAVLLTLLSPGLMFVLAHLHGGWISVRESATTTRMPEPEPKSAPAPKPQAPIEPRLRPAEISISPPASKRSAQESKPHRVDRSGTQQAVQPPRFPIPQNKEAFATPQAEPPRPAKRLRPRFSKQLKTSSLKTGAPVQSSSRLKPSAQGQSWSFLSLAVTAFALVWLVGTGVCLLRRLRGWWLIGTLFRSRTLATDPRVKQAAASAARVVKRGSSLRVYTSSLAPVPLSLGWWSNCIVFPEGLIAELSDQALEDIFVHEAAHLVRRDAWVAVIQQVTTTLFWWNVFLILINRRLARLREEICDDYVLAQAGDGRRFAETLVRVAEWSVNRSPLPAAGTSLLSSAEELADRLTHLTQGAPPMSLQLNKKSRLLLFVLAAGIGSACSWPLLRADAGPRAKSKAAPAETSKNDDKPPRRASQIKPRQQETLEQKLERLVERLRNEKDDEVRLELQEEYNQAKLKLEQERQRKQKEEAARHEKLVRLEKVLNALANKMMREGTAGERLFGAIHLLHAAQKTPRSDHYLSEYLQGLGGLQELLERDFAGHNDSITPQEVAQAIKKAEGGELLKQYRKTEAAFRELAKESPRTDWSAAAKRWHQFASDFLSSGSAEEYAKRWKKHIQADPEHTDLYVLAYLMQIRQRKPQSVDKELLKKFYTDDAEPPARARSRGALRLARIVSVFAAWNAANLPHEDAYRQSLWEELLGVLKVRDINIHSRDTYHLLSRGYGDFWYGLSERERKDFINAMLEHGHSRTLQLLADLAGVDAVTQRRWFLSRTVDMEYIDTPFEDGLEFLMDSAPAATIWRDPAVSKWDKRITMNLSGRWLDALDQFLAKTPFESALLDDGTVWIGPPEKHKAMERRYRELLGMAIQDSRLREHVEVEFFDTPLREALAYIGDANNMSIDTIGGRDFGAVNQISSGFPLFLVLEIMAENTGTKWDLLGDAIVFASEKDFPLWEKAIADYRRQQVTIARLDLAENPLGKKLEARTDMEFVDTAQYLRLGFSRGAIQDALGLCGPALERTMQSNLKPGLRRRFDRAPRETPIELGHRRPGRADRKPRIAHQVSPVNVRPKRKTQTSDAGDSPSPFKICFDANSLGFVNAGRQTYRGV